MPENTGLFVWAGAAFGGFSPGFWLAFCAVRGLPHPVNNRQLNSRKASEGFAARIFLRDRSTNGQSEPRRIIKVFAMGLHTTRTLKAVIDIEAPL